MSHTKIHSFSIANPKFFLAFVCQFFNTAFFLLILSILFLYLEVIAPYVFAKLGGVFNGKKIGSIAFVAIYANFCFFILPLMTSKFIFREDRQSLGLQFPKDKAKASFYIIASLLLLLPLMFFFSTQPQCRVYYFLEHMPLARFIFLHATFVLFYYFAEEFFFRGYLFLGLWKRIGWHSYWITEIIFIIAHLGEPWLEIVLSLPAGVVLSYITLNTRSIYPAMIVHYVMGIFLNILVNFTHYS